MVQCFNVLPGLLFFGGSFRRRYQLLPRRSCEHIQTQAQDTSSPYPLSQFPIITEA